MNWPEGTTISSGLTSCKTKATGLPERASFQARRYLLGKCAVKWQAIHLFCWQNWKAFILQVKKKKQQQHNDLPCKLTGSSLYIREDSCDSASLPINRKEKKKIENNNSECPLAASIGCCAGFVPHRVTQKWGGWQPQTNCLGFCCCWCSPPWTNSFSPSLCSLHQVSSLWNAFCSSTSKCEIWLNSA